MTTLTETLHAGCYVVSEADGFYSRDQVVVALSQTLVAGQVIGKTDVVAGVTSSCAADAGNTGDGVFTIDGTAPVGAGAKNGVYRAVCIAVAADGGEFAVFDPAGVEIGRVAVGATFNNQIKFVIADGATDFAAGDAFSITVGVEAADQQVKALDTTATDGSQRVGGIMYDAVTTDGSNTKIATITARNAEVRGVDLTWPASSFTAAQKAAAIVDLAKLGIIVR